MGAANFHKANADSLYVILDRWYDDDEEKYIYREWDELNEEIINLGRSGEWFKSDRYFGYGRDKDCSVISKDFWFEYFNSGFRYKIEAFITLNSGYYEHCNLDYRLVIDGMDSDENVSDIMDIIVEDFISDCDCCSLCYSPPNGAPWNIGLRKMHKKGFEKALSSFLSQIISECERKCQQMCDEEWNIVCRASDGECFYEKVG